MATEIIKEINLYNSKYHLKIGILFFLFLIFIIFLYKNINDNDSVPFVASFKYIEGINSGSEVQIAGIKIGYVNKITISKDIITINGLIDRVYNIPEDSIIKIKSEGIFWKKFLSIEPGFADYIDRSDQKYIFDQTQDSYSVDMFLRYLNNINE